MVAASTIKRTEDRILTQTASLLNGILNTETNIIEQTNIFSTNASITTTPSSTSTSNTQKRLHGTKLLERIFSSRTSDIAIKFHPCYRQWLKRSQDNDEEIWLAMVKYLVLILGQKSKEEGLCKEATDALASIIRGDPCVEVRLAGIHQICNFVVAPSG